MTDQPALFPDSSASRPGINSDGELVNSVKDSIKAIDANRPIPLARRVYVQVAIELARNIEAGNRKGRAIANEAMQLAAIIATIEGEDGAAADAGDLPEGVREFMAALGQIPTANPAA